MNEIIRDFTTEDDLLPELPDVQSGTALAAYTKQDAAGNPIGVSPILTDLRTRIDAWLENGHSVETKAGRDSIRSFAHIVTKAKGKVKAVGKELADEQKLIPKKIDAARRLLENTIEAWHDEIRQPLTDWETTEKARVEKHTDSIAAIAQAVVVVSDAPAETIRAKLAEVEAVPLTNESCQEFLGEYAIAKEDAIGALRKLLAKREKEEQDAADLARLRAAEEERQRQAEAERLRKEGEERARLEAEADARAEKERSDRKLAEEKAAAEKRERELQQAKEDAERRAQEAAEAERHKIAIEQEEREREQRRREADVAHRAEINRAALTAFVAGGIDEATAKLAIKLIVTGQIPHIQINY